MGTLTADQPRLAEYCDHKLPTSCRLSSIPNCCACADERAHAASYSTYIDGVGFVARGTRWQRYCWFCKEFWENRVQASGLRTGQTRIPEVPDQQPFLDKWYEFHRGYRIVMKEDGSEERIAVLGEELREVSPGVLPRTLEELRAGREQSALEEQMRERERAAVEENVSAGPNLEETLDQLFESVSIEDTPQQQQPTRQIGAAPSNVHAQAMIPTGTRNREYQTRRIAALRRELHRMRNGIERVISGLRDLGEDVPDSSDATGHLTHLGRTLDDISGISAGNPADLAIRSVNALAEGVVSTQTDRSMAHMEARVSEARDHVDEARRMRDLAAAELDVAEQEFRTSQQRLQTIQRDQRTQENYMRLFGTREEMLAAGDNYESPIGGMFTRAMDRFRAAEDVRREERTLRQVLADEARAGGEEEARRLVEFEQRERSEDVWGVPRPPRLVQESTSNTTHLMENARDEVFAGQDILEAQDLADMVAEAQQLDDDIPQGNDDDRTLEEYYALLRRQGWSQQRRSDDQPGGTNFPRSMLDTVVAMREREMRDRNATLQGFANAYRTAASQEILTIDPYFPTSEESRRDMVCLLHALLQRDPVAREMLGLSTATVSAAIYHIGRVSEGPDWETRVGQELGDVELENLLQLDGLVWKSRLPGARLARIRQAGHRVSFSSDPSTNERELHRGNVELMAEAFQTSSELRRKSGLSAPEQLRMLYRLQLSERQPEDRSILATMLQNRDAVDLAKNILRQHEGEIPATDTQRQRNLEELRRQAARQGDSSRQELDQQRQATQAFALAAGRLAMQTGPQALIDQFSTQTETTQAAGARTAYQSRLNDDDQMIRPHAARNPHSDFARAFDLGASSPSASEEEDEDAKGLDAQDTGRPEAKSDEDMTVKLECRICYSQVADVACLPCGHLVMCKWCSEQHSPTMQHDRTRPRRAAGCPACRKGIRQKVRVFRA